MSKARTLKTKYAISVLKRTDAISVKAFAQKYGLSVITVLKLVALSGVERVKVGRVTIIGAHVNEVLSELAREIYESIKSVVLSTCKSKCCSMHAPNVYNILDVRVLNKLKKLGLSTHASSLTPFIRELLKQHVSYENGRLRVCRS